MSYSAQQVASQARDIALIAQDIGASIVRQSNKATVLLIKDELDESVARHELKRAGYFIEVANGRKDHHNVYIRVQYNSPF